MLRKIIKVHYNGNIFIYSPIFFWTFVVNWGEALGDIVLPLVARPPLLIFAKGAKA